MFIILNLIEFNNVSFSYYDEDKKVTNNILKNINVNIKKGEFTVVIGKNGSGKSTFARHFNAILLPTLGNVLIDGINTKDEERLCDMRKKIGMVFQNPDNQIVSSIVEEDVAFGLENLGIPREQIIERTNWALNAVGMQDFNKRASYMLSGGQKQRIAIAGVLAMGTECIVLDEPTSMLDPKGRNEVMKTIVNLNKVHGTAVVLITHNIEEVFYANNVIVMNNGEIILQGTPKDVLSSVEYHSMMGLNTSQAMELIGKLNKKGINIPNTALNEQECIDIIVGILEGK